MSRLVLATLYVLAAAVPVLAGDDGKAGRPEARDLLLVSGAWLEGALDDPRIVVLHVSRGRKPYEEGHVPGARFVAWSDVAIERDGVPDELPPVEALEEVVRRLGVGGEDEVVAYDDENGALAARVYVAFDYVGLGDRTALLDGQWKKWVAEGRVVSTEEPAVRRSDFVARPRPEILASEEDVKDAIDPAAKKKVLLLDARPQREYAGEVPGEGIKRGGHVPGARSVPLEANLAGGDPPVMKRIAELRALYEEAGVESADEIVAYCRTGRQASMTYFALKYLGYDPKLFDGSWSGWSSREENPIETGAGRR